MANDLRAEIRFKNARLWSELHEQFGGFAETKRVYTNHGPIMRVASEVLGVTKAMLGDLLNLKVSPIYKDGSRKPIAENIATKLGVEFDELFPATLYALRLPRVLVREFESPQLLSIQEARRELRMLPAPGPTEDEQLSEIDQRTIVAEALSSLSPRQEKILRLRFGLNDGERECSLSEIGVTFAVGKERVRQIEAKGLSVLRKNKQLKAVHDGKG